MSKLIDNIVLLTLFMQINISAQFSFVKFEKFNINNGLSNQSINCITQTSDGYLWIATKDGLNRYDGQSFKIFKHNPSDPTSLPENYIMYLLESKDGTLWVGTWGRGLCKYDPVQESFIKIKQDNNLFIQCIFEDHIGNIWFGTTTHGLFKLNPKSLIIINYNKIFHGKNFFPAENVLDISEDQNYNLWIATWDAGFIKFNPSSSEIIQFKHEEGNKNSLADNKIWSITKVSEKSFLLSTNSGLDLFDIKSKTFTHHPGIPSSLINLVTTSIRQVIIDHKGSIWIGSYDYRGIFLIDKDMLGKSRLTHLHNEEDNTTSLVCNRIRYLYEDRQRNIWIGTEDGLNLLQMTKPFNQYRFMPLRKQSLGGRVVSSVIEGRGKKLWVGFGGDGFDCVDLSVNNISHFKYNPFDSNSLSGEDVTTIFEDNKGIIWIGTNNNGLNRYDPIANKFKHYLRTPGYQYSLKSNWIQQILETSCGLFLVGTNDALQVFDRNKEQFLPFKPYIIGDQFPDSISVNSLFEDREKNIWVGTWLDGLYRYDPSKKTTSSLSTQQQQFKFNKR